MYKLSELTTPQIKSITSGWDDLPQPNRIDGQFVWNRSNVLGNGMAVELVFSVEVHC